MRRKKEHEYTYLDLLHRRLSPEKILPLVRREVRMRSLEKQVVFLRARHDCNLKPFRKSMYSGVVGEVDLFILQT